MTSTKTIITIGGGDVRKNETQAIDREIVKRSGKRHPRLIFLPTASSDNESYCQAIKKYFEGAWRCRVDALQLIRERPSSKMIADKIETADIIYVGGGNTLKMMRVWRRLGVDKLLRSAYRRGVVLCGVSAGSICWYEFGHSDSMASYNPSCWSYIKVRGLGLIQGVHCPHYNSQTKGVPRRVDFRTMIEKHGGCGLAVDNRCALEFIDGKYYRVISAKSGAGAYLLQRRRGSVVTERIAEQSKLAPLEDLWRRARQLI